MEETKLMIKYVADSKKSVIVVDSREFSSLTPLYLKKKGFWIVPS